MLCAGAASIYIIIIVNNYYRDWMKGMQINYNRPCWRRLWNKWCTWGPCSAGSLLRWRSLVFFHIPTRSDVTPADKNKRRHCSLVSVDCSCCCGRCWCCWNYGSNLIQGCSTCPYIGTIVGWPYSCLMVKRDLSGQGSTVTRVTAGN